MPGLGYRVRACFAPGTGRRDRARVEEIYSLVQQVVRESGYEEVLSSGIVVTGGSCVMPGMVELGETFS